MNERTRSGKIHKAKLGVDDTVDLLKTELARRNVPLFAEFDHRRNAQEAGLDLRPTRVLVFGAPAVGTLLMQANQGIALELPLRLAVWEEADGSVLLAATDMDALAAAYGLEQLPAVGKIRALLEDLAALARQGA